MRPVFLAVMHHHALQLFNPSLVIIGVVNEIDFYPGQAPMGSYPGY